MSRSKARRDRRKRSRMNYLAELAQKSPKAFTAEWQIRLEGWANEARHRARTLVEGAGASVPSAFSLLTEAEMLLQACGDSAVSQHGAATRECLSEACAIAVAEASHPSLSPAVIAQRKRERSG